MFRVYTERVNLSDYPVYAQQLASSGRTSTPTSGSASAGDTVDERVLDRPGLYLAEHHALRGVRYGAGLGYLATVLIFYGYHRPRLSLADRPLAKLHHWFYPSAGYATPVGLLAGLSYGAVQESGRLSEAVVESAFAADAAAARAAHAQYMHRKAAAEARVVAAEAWYERVAVRLRLMKDTRGERLARANFTAERDVWTAFVRPCSVLWVAQHSQRVHDPRWYRGELPADCVVTSSSLGSSSPASGGDRGRPPPPSPPPPSRSPPTTPLYTKRQFDGLVSRVLLLQNDKEEARWTRTGGRFSLYGIFAMLIAWNSGNALFRLSMGLGAGVVAGGVVSAMKLDAIWTHL